MSSDSSKEKLFEQLEELMVHYERLANRCRKIDPNDIKTIWYFQGVAEGLNKAWKLLDGDETVEDLKA